MKVLSVVSTRPELIKMAPVMKEVERRGIEHVFVATGQHYDLKLFAGFFDGLGLTPPKEKFELASGSQAFRTGAALQKMEGVVEKHSPDVVLAEGDTNSILAAAIASQKLLVPFGHVEAGLRSFDRTMPEEINRVMCDHCSELLFAPTELSALQLLLEKIPKKKVFITGNTVVDACMQHLEAAKEKSRILGELDFDEFVVFTCHRKENTSPEQLPNIIEVLSSIPRNVVFPIHPRTENALKGAGLYKKLESLKHVKVLPPLPYLDFLLLMNSSQALVTDSGGLQEEATVLAKKCVVLRENTERPEAMTENVVLAGLNAERVSEALEDVSVKKAPCPFGDGRAAQKIVDVLEKKAEAGELKVEASSFVETNYPEYELVRVTGEFAGKTVEDFEKQDGEVNLLFENGRARYPRADHVLREGESLLVKK